MKSDNVITRAANHYGEKIISTFSGDIKEELSEDDDGAHGGENSGRGEHTGNPAAPLSLFQIKGAEEGEIKEHVRKRGRKSHFSDLFMMQGRYPERIRTCSSGHTVREDEVSS